MQKATPSAAPPRRGSSRSTSCASTSGPVPGPLRRRQFDAPIAVYGQCYLRCYTDVQL